MKYLALMLFVPTIALAGKSNTGSSNGRFQIIQLSDMRSDQHMIDTQTGKIWTKTCVVSGDSSCDYMAWMPDTVAEITTSRKEIFETADKLQKFKEAMKNKDNGQ